MSKWFNIHKKTLVKGSVSVISSDLPCPIHNGTLETFIWSKMWKYYRLKVFISDKYFETKSKGEKTIKDINLSSFNIQKWFIVI